MARSKYPAGKGNLLPINKPNFLCLQSPNLVQQVHRGDHDTRGLGENT